MGRIAEALKKAQRERARRTGESVLPGPIAEPASGAAAVSPESEAACGHVGLAGLMTPPTPQPFVVSSSPIAPQDVSPETVVFHDPASAISERYRSARTRLLTSHADGGARIFAITSSLPREGKTVTTANLAFGLAELKHLRVAMIDCDFRNQGLARSFNVSDRPGLAEVIRGEKSLADVCVPVVRENLYLIPAGRPKSMSSSELLAGSAAAAVFREINDRFHYGLIDTPPTNTVADIGLVAPLCHSVLIVIRMGKTPENLLRRCVRTLQANHVAIAGSILVGYCEKTMGYTDTHDYYQGHP